MTLPLPLPVDRLAAALLAAWALSCGDGVKRAPVMVRNPDYIVVRPIRQTSDAEHTIRVEFPYTGAGYGYAALTPLVDLNSIDIEGATFAGGRTSIVGEATIWLPLKPEASQRLQTWAKENAGDYLGIFLRGQLVAAPQVTAYAGGGIPLRVPSKAEGDLVLRELRRGGVTETDPLRRTSPPAREDGGRSMDGRRPPASTTPAP